MGRTWGAPGITPEAEGDSGPRLRGAQDPPPTPTPVAGHVASRAPPVRCQLPLAAALQSSHPRPLGPFHLPRLGLGFCWFLGDKNRLK